MSHNEAPISVNEAERRLEELPLDWGRERLPLERAAGRVLAGSLCADRDFPPFDRVAMDGIAVSSVALLEGRREFTVRGIQGAGEVPLAIESLAEAVEIMTGAVLSTGCDTIIPVEDLERVGPALRLKPGVQARPGQHIHAAGSDASAGDLLLHPGRLLHGPALAAAASVGATTLEVVRRPRIAVLATGSELVDVSQQPAAHQIRVSNLSALQAGLELDGHTPAWCGRVSDERTLMGRTLQGLLEGHEIVVLSGGVSMGRYDHVPGLLRELGCRLLFHGVRQRPGRPLLAAVGPAGQLVLALPGNPVTAVICLHRYLLPLLRRREGRPQLNRTARLIQPVHWGRPLALFLATSVDSGRDNQLEATPLPSSGSGDVARLAESDGFLELAEGAPGWEAGDQATFRPWGPR